MNKSEELQIMSNSYAKKSRGDYPFISEHRVTVLRKGFYRKKRADYRGISMIPDNGLKALLIGYYYVPTNTVIVPDGMEITPPKQKLINDKIREGFEVAARPSLKPYEFEKDSKEYKLAFEARKEYINAMKDDKISNGQEV